MKIVFTLSLLFSLTFTSFAHAIEEKVDGGESSLCDLTLVDNLSFSMELSTNTQLEIQKQQSDLKRYAQTAPSDRALVWVPSFTFDPDTLAGIKAVNLYEYRLLVAIVAAAKDQEIVFIATKGIKQSSVDHLFEVAGVTGDHLKKARKNLHIIEVPSQRSGKVEKPLIARLNEQSEVIERVKRIIRGRPAMMSSFLSTHQEWDFAHSVGAVNDGVHPDLDKKVGSKSGNAWVFNEAQVNFPRGYHYLKDSEALIRALPAMILQKQGKFKLNQRHGSNDKGVVVPKTEDGVSGTGNAELSAKEFNFDQFRDLKTFEEQKAYVLEYLRKYLKPESKELEALGYLSRFDKFGGIVQEFIPDVIDSPSVTLFGGAESLEVLSNQVQRLDGKTYKGLDAPAPSDYRGQLVEEALKVGKVLYQLGVRGVFSIDFLVSRNPKTKELSIWAIEINVRRGGTTHPFLTASLLADAKYDYERNQLVDNSYRPLFVAGTDNHMDENLKYVQIDELHLKAREANLLYSPEKGSGVVFHLQGAMRQEGKLGYIVLGHSRDEVVAIEEQVKQFLEELPAPWVCRLSQPKLIRQTVGRAIQWILSLSDGPCYRE